MMSQINREAYEKLIAEDLAAIATLPDSLERNHIEQVLWWSIDQLYPIRTANKRTSDLNQQPASIQHPKNPRDAA